MTQTLSGWGRHPVVDGREFRSEDLSSLARQFPLTRGLARSYGDACLPPGDRPEIAGSRLADRILDFDTSSGLLRAEAGLSLHDLNRIFLPRRWFVPVSPGTQFVTLGGMVAADVHGKNHHVDGTFGRHVESLRLQTADGETVECLPGSDLFRATVGGMGLTGHILEVSFRMRQIPSPWIYGESERIPDIETFVRALKDAGRTWPFTVGWIDCLSRGRGMGRGILMVGRWAESREAPASPPPPRRRMRVPVDFPSVALSRPTIRLFNELYFRRHPSRRRNGILHPESFFYPLDAIGDWNRLYGAAGFTQYQCVVPDENGHQAKAFLELLTELGGASFLCVIKDCGAEGDGLLSFPRPGISIALDLPIRAGTRALVAALNQRVIELGGRIYLAKDALTQPQDFERMEPRLPAFRELRRRFDPSLRLGSRLSCRLIDPAPPD